MVDIFSASMVGFQGKVDSEPSQEREQHLINAHTETGCKDRWSCVPVFTMSLASLADFNSGTSSAKPSMGKELGRF
jgi:hypothetical protein